MRKGFVLLGNWARLLFRDQSGQAVIEYVLMVSVMVSATGALAYGLRKTLFALWQSFAQDITAACPGCPPDPAIKISSGH